MDALPMVRRMWTWNANRSDGPLYATQDEAAAANPYWERRGEELVAVYVAAGDGEIIHHHREVPDAHV